MRKSLAILVCGVLFFVGVMAALAPADAGRRGGARGHHHHHAHRGHHRHRAAHRHFHHRYAAHRDFNRGAYANRRIVYRNGVRGYWRNGRWIAAPIAAGTGAGVAGYVATCAYEYNRWQATGSTYWRSKYNQCAGI